MALVVEARRRVAGCRHAPQIGPTTPAAATWAQPMRSPTSERGPIGPLHARQGLTFCVVAAHGRSKSKRGAAVPGGKGGGSPGGLAGASNGHPASVASFGPPTIYLCHASPPHGHDPPPA